LAHNNIQAKVEAALFALIASQQSSIPTVLIKKGMSEGEIAEPCVIVECYGADPHEQLGPEGVWIAHCRATVRTSPDEFISGDFGNATSATQSERVGIVYDAIMTDSAAATLSSSVADFYVFDGGHAFANGILFDGLTQEIRNRGWGSVLSFSVVCCGSDIS
jgi:hypothetical protein